MKLFKRKKKVSFAKYYNEVKLPVMKFWHNGHELNFLIDTGADMNYIRKDCKFMLKPIKEIKGENSIMTAGGMEESDGMVLIPLSDDNGIFSTVFTIHNGIEIWDNESLRHGYIIHGILGTTFMKERNLKIDFKKLEIS